MNKKTTEGIKITGRVRAIVSDAFTGAIKHDTGWCKNLITDAGRVAILRRLGNEATYSNEGMITYGAVGSGAVAPTVADTIMEAEIERKLVSVTTVRLLTLTVETFFTTSEANGTITQFALFGETATAAADSGTMFEHVSFSGSFTKTVLETLTVESQITLS